MPYTINIGELSHMFAVPSRVADKLIKLSGAIQLKVLLIALNSNPAKIEAKKIADKLGISDIDVTDALNYWVECGILTNAELPNTDVLITNTAEVKPKKAAKIEIVKPNREEVLKRGKESTEITFLLREAQLKFGRPLRQNESSTLLWLYDNEGFSVPIILQLISFSVNEGKANIGFIERTALGWIKDGVTTIEDAEKQIAMHQAKKSAWGKVCSAMGIDNRMPSSKEAELAFKWVEEYGYDNAMLRLAYESCVDSAAKFSMNYVSKIIDNWYKNDAKTPDDVANINERRKPSTTTKPKDSFNLDDYQKSLEELPE